MATPEWASSMISNYRQLYKERYGQDSSLSNDAIWKICNTVFHDEDKAIEDEARVETMREEEQA